MYNIYMYNICTCKTNYIHTPQNKDHFDVGFGFTTGWNGVMEWGTLFSNLILVAVWTMKKMWVWTPRYTNKNWQVHEERTHQTKCFRWWFNQQRLHGWWTLVLVVGVPVAIASVSCRSPCEGWFQISENKLNMKFTAVSDCANCARMKKEFETSVKCC